MHVISGVQGRDRGVQNNAVIMNREGETDAKDTAERGETGQVFTCVETCG